jgi:hypothetical protein
VAVWRFRRSRHDINFPNIKSLEEAEFLTPSPPVLTDAHRARHHQEQR